MNYINRSLIYLSILLVSIIPVGSLLAATPVGTKIKTEVPVENASFGFSIAQHESTAVVGAVFDGADNGGRVYIYNLETNEFQNVFASPTSEFEGYFGYAVAIDSEFFLASAPLEDVGGSDRGIVHAYDLDAKEWFPISSPFPEDGAFFGISLTIENGIALIGAPRENAGGSDRGAVYVYDLRNRQFVDRVTVEEGADGDEFGGSVALEGTLFAASAWKREHPGGATDSGSVYLFKRGTDNPIRRIDHPNPTDVEVFGDFGVSVDLKNGVLAVGALQEEVERVDSDDNDEGVAYVFRAGSGELLHRLTPRESGRGESFGRNVQISGGMVLVGAPEDSSNQPTAGAAYVFDLASGRQIHRLVPSDQTQNDEFGFAVSLAGSTLLIGSRFEDQTSPNGSGAIYRFQLGYRPDLLLGPNSRQLRGNNRYDLTGRSQRLTRRTTRTVTFVIRAENDGHLVDRLGIRLRRNGANGPLRSIEVATGRNITGALLRNRFTTSRVFPGEGRTIRTRATIRRTRRPISRSHFIYDVRSNSQASLRDRGRVQVLKRNQRSARS